ncbi:Emc10p NDAI_0A07610 [Naumovozyma dairenensis CBS 421]|uniref:ER membrane protein complex subunit 7 beta-sandwich domain-containing protein n=1 Tax=Naumovozyma dairenensis (strain ATCC 10597 / BCRC 20456 / CBS 421 / NBRC 0211 / NRRL Y-12639) TaxID=1071378 RepID=G0W527_NAUDC|nr:hypothetical protein NDAI_0A07610 [Naumovozyma dairenensis CBS 421]CCD22915.1 hypothetical protein NDAI_0A07610 [Naumovozyma dairenensis CBS 421]
MRTSLFLLFLPFTLCEKVTLSARNVTGANQPEYPLGLIELDISDNNATTIIQGDFSNIPTGPYCIGATFEESGKNIPCFSYLQLENPFHYDLIIDLQGEEISKLSLLHNIEKDGINAIIREPINGPVAPAIKLKKITKTYADKKANKQSGSEQFAEEDEEPVEGSWIQNNWKMLLVGLLVYNLVANRSTGGEKEE